MNDFTKDELLLLKNGIQYLSDRTSLSEGYFDICNTIESKLKSMIDSYCEHEFYVNGCGENVFGQCHKCGEVRRLVRK